LTISWYRRAPMPSAPSKMKRKASNSGLIGNHGF
jgi:hypothetical protein